MSSAVGRSHFDPPNAAGGNEKHGKNRSSSRATSRPRKGRAPQRIRLGTFVMISSGFRTRGNVKRQRQRSTFRAPTRNRTAARLARVQNHGVVVDRLRARVETSGGRAPRKIQLRGAGVYKARWRISGVGRRRPIFETRPMSSLHAAPLIHRHEGPRKIMMACSISRINETNNPPGDRIGVPPGSLAVRVALINEQGDQAGVDGADAARRAVERTLAKSAGAQELRADGGGPFDRPDGLELRKLGAGGAPKLEVFRDGFLRFAMGRSLCRTFPSSFLGKPHLRRRRLASEESGVAVAALRSCLQSSIGNSVSCSECRPFWQA